MQTGDFEYHKDKKKTESNRIGKFFTVGDVGLIDEDGYLFLRDRKIDMIISGGANIYPAEIENVLLGFPKVGDVAVFGIPHDDWGEEIKAVIEPAEGIEASPELAEEILEYCADPPGQVQDAQVDRLHRLHAPRPQRQALQAQAAGSLLGGTPRRSDRRRRCPRRARLTPPGGVRPFRVVGIVQVAVSRAWLPAMLAATATASARMAASMSGSALSGVGLGDGHQPLGPTTMKIPSASAVSTSPL